MAQWFLPSRFQGVELFPGDPVLYVNSPKGVDLKSQREVIRAIQSLNSVGNATYQDPEIATRIAQYELAFKMQSSTPELWICPRNPTHPRSLWNQRRRLRSFASNCLLAKARRTRTIHQLYHRGWDHRWHQRWITGHSQIWKGYAARQDLNSAACSMKRSLSGAANLAHTVAQVWT